MSNVAYLLKDKTSREILDLNLKVHVGVEPKACSDVNELKQFCLSHPEAIVIIEKDSQLNVDINKKENNISQIISIGELSSKESDFKIENIQQWRDLVLFMKKIVPASKAQEGNEIYIAVELFYFSSLPYSPFTVYSQVSDGKGGLLFIEIFEAFEDISYERIEALKEKGVTHLWLLKRNKVEFLSFVSKEIIKTNALVPALGISEAYNVVHGLFKNIGITPEVYKACQAAVSEMEKSVSKNDDLKIYFEMLKTGPDLKFSYKLAQTTYVLCISGLRFLSKMSTVSEIEKKLSYACFLRDFGLKNDHWVRIRTDEQLMNTPGVKLNDRMSIQYHAREASRIVALMPDVPRESVRIILEHHGSKTGEGFKAKMNDDLHPLSAYLYLIEEFSYRVLVAEEKMNLNMDRIIDDLLAIFPYQWSKHILEGFKKSL